MPNIGIAPPDPATPVGQMRFVVKDTVYIELAPPVVGYGDYVAFSDAELEAMIALSNGNVFNAIGMMWLELAGKAAGQSVEWASDDLRLNLTKTSSDLLAIAKIWFDRGRDQDDALGLTDNFLIVPTGQDEWCEPELAARIWNRCL